MARKLRNIDIKDFAQSFESGNYWFVDTVNGATTKGGTSFDDALKTIQAAVNKAAADDTIVIAPGEYDEAVTIARAKSNLTLRGAGGRGSVFIAPSAANAIALTIHADDVTIFNVGLDGDGTGGGLLNTGRRTRIYESKLEGGDGAGGFGAKLSLGTVAQVDAGTHGKGDDLWFIDCEFAYNESGVLLSATDRGAVTQARFRNCTFHDNTKDFFESLGSGGSADVSFRDLDLSGCKFRRMEDGTEPTMYLDLDGHASANKGVVADCEFPTALAGGKVLIGTGVIFVSNKMTGGISTGQPS